MLQQLALETNAQLWAIASMLLFIAVFTAVVIHIFFRTPSAQHEAAARLPLQDGEDGAEPARDEGEER
jgi:cbb3-type cytochrome oxidase subunit 3